MKKIQILFLSLLLGSSFLFESCSKKSSDTDTTAENALSTQIAAKWNVDDASSSYKSFEFNKSSQAIVTKQNGKATSHSYKVKDAKTVEIKDLGTLLVDEISGSDLKMKLTLIGNTTHIQIQSKKSSNQVSNSSTTETICRTWKVTKFTKNGIDQDLPSTDPIAVTFTNAGTYFIDLIGAEFDSVGIFTNYWKWSNSLENEFCYSRVELPACDKKAQISSLTATSLVVSEIIGGKTEITYLVPFTFPARIATSGIQKSRKGSLRQIFNKNSFLF